MTIDQFYFSRLDPSSGASTVLMIDNHLPFTVNLGVGFFPSLMGTFDYSPPFGDVKLISTVPNQPRDEIFQVSLFRTNYFTDLWNLPSPSNLKEGKRHPDMSMAGVSYNIVKQASTNLDLTPA
jgi:hypothetical protein